MTHETAQWHTPNGHFRPEALLLNRLAEMVPRWARNAGRLDATATVPVDEIQDLRDVGAFTAPLPEEMGGFGLGTEPSGATGLFTLLRLIGRGNLSLGRIFEGHVNALKLVALYGTSDQLHRTARDAADGHLFAIWATETTDPVILTGSALRGTKSFCSAAALVTRGLITATMAEGGSQLVLVPLRAGERASVVGLDTHGMRGCGTGRVDFEGIALPRDALIGKPGDYLRQPAFSAGAWRASAVALGGLDALVAEVLRQLVARKRDSDPHQQARIGQLLIAVETASLWAGKAARIGESDGEPGDVSNYVNLARCAIETACLSAMCLAQRSLGLAAFVRPNPVERLLRDLATYLRQPAPDEALTDAAAWFTTRDLPQDARG